MTHHFRHVQLPDEPDTVAPDGSEVRLLGRLTHGSLAHFTLAPGQISKPVKHQTVEEMWYVVGGTGQMWVRQAESEQIVTLSQGTAICIPVGTHFQFRCDSVEPLVAIGVTMPPWPGMDEAIIVKGIWHPKS